MKFFTELISDLSTSHDEKKNIQLLTQYFNGNDSIANKNEALNLLIGNGPKKLINSHRLKSWAKELTDFPQWIIDRSEQETGNFVKTLALLFRSKHGENNQDHSINHWTLRIAQLSESSHDEIKSFLIHELTELEVNGRSLLLKLITGTFKSPVSEFELIQVFSQIIKEPPEIVSLRLYESKSKKQISFNDLYIPVDEENNKIPCPFPDDVILEQPIESLGSASDWKAFGNRAGIKAQLIKHTDSIHLWSRKNEILSHKFPEIITSGKTIAGNFAAYGQILPKNAEVPNERLSARLRKKSISKKDRQIAEPIFEIQKIINNKESNWSVSFRTNTMESNIFFKKDIDFATWQELKTIHQDCRKMGFAGILLEHKNQRGKYYFWKANTFSIKAILMYVEFGGMENSGFHSLTFGLYNKEEIVPIAKINIFPSFVNLNSILEYVRNNTIERFGPVRTVKPSMVFELYFDSVTKSPRRKSGLALVNVRIERKISNDPKYTDSLDTLKSLIA